MTQAEQAPRSSQGGGVPTAKESEPIVAQPARRFRIASVFLVVLSLLTAWAAIEYGSLVFMALYSKVRGTEVFGVLGITIWHPLLFPQQQVGPRQQAIWHPYRTYANPPNMERLVGALATDRYGFIHNGTAREYAIPKPTGVKRVILLGGSAVEGQGASANSTTIAAALERFLARSQSAKFEVINAAVGGYASVSEVVYVIVDLGQFEPDYLITFDGFNDIWLAMELWMKKRAITPNYSLYQDRVVEKLQREASVWWHMTQGFSLIQQRVFPYSMALRKRALEKLGHAWAVHRNQSIRNSAPLCRPEVSRTTADHYLRNLQTLEAIASRHGMKLVLTVQPHHLMHTSLNGTVHLRDDYRRCFLEYYAAIQEGLHRMGERQDGSLKTYSFVPIFAEREAEVFTDSVHLNDIGQSVVAATLASLIDEFENQSATAALGGRRRHPRTLAAVAVSPKGTEE